MTDYAQIQALNWSTIKLLAESPLAYVHGTTHPPEDTPAYRLGRALHCAVLEPERFGTAYVCQPDFGDGRTKEARAAKADWLATVPPGAETLRAEEYASVLGATAAVRAHRVAAPLLHAGRAEEVVTWTDEGTGLACKARLDYLRPSGVVELKSARRLGRRFSADAAGYLYHGQCAWYHDGAVAAGLLAPDAELPHLLAVTLDAPHDVMVLRMTPATYLVGQALYRSLLARLLECRAAEVWPGCAPDLVDWDLPGWAAGIWGPESEDGEGVGF